jgi:hypothetical protein
MANSNTVPKQLKPFTKGDPRINRKGRPKTFDALRELAQMIAHERSGVVIKDGHELTVAEAIIRQWAQSKNPILQQKFIEIAYGKVPQQIDLGLMDAVKAYIGISPDDWDTEDKV